VKVMKPKALDFTICMCQAAVALRLSGNSMERALRMLLSLGRVAGPAEGSVGAGMVPDAPAGGSGIVGHPPLLEEADEVEIGGVDGEVRSVFEVRHARASMIPLFSPLPSTTLRP
jgi:hypothetical protein